MELEANGGLHIARLLEETNKGTIKVYSHDLPLGMNFKCMDESFFVSIGGHVNMGEYFRSGKKPIDIASDEFVLNARVGFPGTLPEKGRYGVVVLGLDNQWSDRAQYKPNDSGQPANFSPSLLTDRTTFLMGMRLGNSIQKKGWPSWEIGVYKTFGRESAKGQSIDSTIINSRENTDGVIIDLGSRIDNVSFGIKYELEVQPENVADSYYFQSIIGSLSFRTGEYTQMTITYSKENQTLPGLTTSNSALIVGMKFILKQTSQK